MKQAQQPEALRPSEAVYAFAAWLTTRNQRVTFSGADDASIAAELVADFVNSQGFEQPRDDYHTRLKPYPVEAELADLSATPPAPAVVAVPDERSAFEVWAESVGLDHLARGLGKQDDYAFVETRRMWEAWQGRAALAAPQAQDVQRDALTQAAREVLAAVEKLPRYTYGYKNDGESRHLSSYESPDGRFLDRAKVIAAIAASAKGGV